MLKQQTRERLQALVQHRDFTNISVGIKDMKIRYVHNGEIGFSVDVNIHTEGEGSLTRITQIIPEIQVIRSQVTRVEQENHIDIGEFVSGKLEEATVNIWSTFNKIPKEKAPTAMGAVLENTQFNYTTESEVVANA